MRALSNAQANRCETAKNKTCRCRCAGALHGAKRGQIDPDAPPWEPDREFFEALPEDDPHHVRSPEEKKKRAKIKRQLAKAPLQTRLWEELV